MSTPSHVISGRIDDDTIYETNAENSAKRDRNDGVTFENKDTGITGIPQRCLVHVL